MIDFENADASPSVRTDVSGRRPRKTDGRTSNEILMLDWAPDEKARKLIMVDNPRELFSFR